MTEGIFLERDGQLVDMRYAPYVSEDELQELLERHAVLLAGDQMSPGRDPRRFVLVRREAGVPDAPDAADRWSVDHLFIDQDAVPTLVEVKRSENTQIRREIVGQMFDYAANAVVHWPEGAMAAHFNATHALDEGGPIEALRRFLDLSESSVQEADADIETWWQQADANLRAGRLRLLFVADQIPSELRRIIEFLNQQMSTSEVLGIEIRNYQGDGLRALVPQVVGLTEVARDRKSRRAPAVPLFEVWDTVPAEVAEARLRLDDWAQRVGAEATDLTKSRRYRVGKTTVAYLYPTDEYRLVYIELMAAGDGAIAEQLRSELSRIRGGAPVAPKEPTITCQFLVSAWSDIESSVLTPLALAARDHSQLDN